MTFTQWREDILTRAARFVMEHRKVAPVAPETIGVFLSADDRAALAEYIRMRDAVG